VADPPGAAPIGWNEEVAMSHDPSNGDDVAGADDLTRIGGIGSKIAERLTASGIRTYAELASRSAADIAMLLPDVTGLSPARLDTWRDQARELAATAPAAQAVPETSAGAPDDGQHYESFLVRVLLNEDGSVRRTTAQNIRTGAERHWSGLDREALPDFIETAISASTASAEAAAEQPSDQAYQPAAMTPRPGQSPPAAAYRAPLEAHGANLASSAVLSVERTLLRAAEPFTMTMTVDLAAQAIHADRLAYSAVIVARPMAGGPKRTVAQSDGLLGTTSSTISIDAAGLPPGAYRLDGAVSLREPGGDRLIDLAAVAEGLLVQVLPA
jgi:Helix-hairpin-helix domain